MEKSAGEDVLSYGLLALLVPRSVFVFKWIQFSLFWVT